MEALTHQQSTVRCFCAGAPSRANGRSNHWVCAAGRRDESARDQPQQPKKSKLPQRGFFAEADTKAEVYSPLRGVSSGDKRYNPEFLWNTNWQEQMALEEAVERQQQQAQEQQADMAAGGISFSRVAQLNSMDVDLTEQLVRKRKEDADAAAADAAQAATSTPQAAWQGRQAEMQAVAEAKQQRGPSTSGYPKMPPRRGEAKRWERTGKFAKRAPVNPPSPTEAEAMAATLAAEREAYARYKQQLLITTAGLGAALSAATYAFYSKDVSSSYALGAVASIAYLNMLNRSIDAVGASDMSEAGGAIGGATAQPRLLIPIILAMGYNRWNTLAAESTGVTLQLMPILLGFLTYKASVIARGALDLFRDLAGGTREADIAAADVAAAAAAASQTLGDDAAVQPAPGKADEVMVSREYANRILQG